MRLLIVLALAVLAVACGGEAPAANSDTSATSGGVGDLPPSEPFDRAVARLVAPSGDAREISVYVADAPAERQRGLMGRTVLPADAGMVFRFAGEHRGGFWMKDTLIPLSIAFYADDGRVLEVLDMTPCSADPCQVYDPGVTYRGALEVNRGFFDDVGLRPGWRVELPDDLPPAS